MESDNNIIQILSTLEIACLVLAALFFIVAVVLFFVLDIRKVFNDVTGRTAKKEIANMRAQNVTSGSKAYKSSAVNKSRSKLTSKISASGKIQENKGIDLSLATEKIAGSRFEDESTLILNGGGSAQGGTTVLGGNETSVLGGAAAAGSGATTVLGGQDDGTVLLGGEAAPNDTTVLNGMQPTAGAAELVQEIVYIHTEEIIY